MVRKLSEMRPDIGRTSIDNFLTDHLGYAEVCVSGKLKEDVSSYLRGAAVEFYDSDIQKIVYRMQKCINLNGGYVEK